MVNSSSGMSSDDLIATDMNSLLRDSSSGSCCFIPSSNKTALSLAKYSLFYYDA